MSLPFFPMYPSDFEADTSHLTLEEDGAYNRLLRLMWMTNGCSLPDDNAWIGRRMRVDTETFERVVLGLLDEFFVRSNNRVSNARLTSIFDESSAAHKRRVDAGSRGGKAKPLKTKGSTASNAEAKPKQPEPQPQPYKEVIDTTVSISDTQKELIPFEPAKPKKRRRKPQLPLPGDFEMPESWIAPAIKDGVPDDLIAKQFEKFKKHHLSKGNVMADWKQAWGTWTGNYTDFKPRGNNNGSRSYNGTTQQFAGKNANMQSSLDALDKAVARRGGH